MKSWQLCIDIRDIKKEYISLRKFHILWHFINKTVHYCYLRVLKSHLEVHECIWLNYDYNYVARVFNVKCFSYRRSLVWAVEVDLWQNLSRIFKKIPELTSLTTGRKPWQNRDLRTTNGSGSDSESFVLFIYYIVTFKCLC